MIKSTRISGYVDTPVPKKCGTCRYLKNGNLCRNDVVARDSQVSTDPATGMKQVNAENGCCNEWVPSASPDADTGSGRAGRRTALTELLARSAGNGADGDKSA